MSDSNKLKVLVADDSSTVHGLFGEIARNSPVPFEIIRAHDGRECAKKLDETIQLAFIAANANKRRQQLAIQLKIYEFLAKPFAAEQVFGILNTYRRITAPAHALIVDDSATVRRIIRRVLGNSIFNIEATEASDDGAALAFCENGDFDVVFLDCNMPGINGLETLDRLLQRDPHARVIMISGERNEERKFLALQRGAVAFFYKTFFPTDIDRELHALFGLKMPALATVEPMRLARANPFEAEIAQAHWTG